MYDFFLVRVDLWWLEIVLTITSTFAISLSIKIVWSAKYSNKHRWLSTPTAVSCHTNPAHNLVLLDKHRWMSVTSIISMTTDTFERFCFILKSVNDFVFDDMLLKISSWCDVPEVPFHSCRSLSIESQTRVRHISVRYTFLPLPVCELRSISLFSCRRPRAGPSTRAFIQCPSE